MKKNWLTLNSETFLWIKGEEGLLYNTLNATSFPFANIGEVEKICNELLKVDNLYSVMVSDNQLQDKKSVAWIDSIITINMGCLTREVTYEERPVSLMPILKVQDNTQRYVWEHNRGIQGTILDNLHEVFFYINGTANGENELYKQIIYPLKINESLDYRDIIDFCFNSKNPYLTRIYLIGSLFTYPSYSILLNELHQLHIQLVITVTDVDYLHYMQAYTDLAMQEDIIVQVMIKNVNDIEELLINHDKVDVHYYFLVASEAEYEYVLDTTKKDDNKLDYQIIPIVKDNLDFFRNLVYLDEKELTETPLTKRDIFVRQSINLNDFGRLMVLPDGRVYSNVNHPSLGTIKNLPIDIVYKEFTKGQSWFNVRKQKPCSDCIYQWLCPSPSNIELAIGKPNLCLMKE